MASTNGSGRPSGCVTIPVEIIRGSGSTGTGGSHSRHNSPFRTHIDNQYGGFSDSPPWNLNSTSRFQPRQSPNTAYDRVITNSQFNQPLDDRSSYQQYQEPENRYSQQRMYETGPSQFSRSSEDLLSSPFDSMRFSAQPQYASLIPPSFGSGFRDESDFVQPIRHTTPLGRSYDALNDFSDMHQSFPTTRQYPSEQQQQQQPYYRTIYQTQPQSQQQQHQQQQKQQQQPTYVNQTYINPDIVYTNEYGVPTDRFQPNTFQGAASDRSRSPASQRGASPARPPPSTSQQQQQQQPQEEPELKMAKDTTGPIPMPAPASSPPSQSTDEQVPPAETTAATNFPAPQPEPVRDPDTIALEKLELIKQSLANLEQEVDAFVGSSRNERAYKLIDEAGLKIMIRCDELVDVSADIKEKRKEIIRNVQRVIGKLESKVPSTPAASKNSNAMNTTSSNDKSPINTNAAAVTDNTQANAEKKSSPSSSPPKENASAPSTTEQTK